jgi:hypothetical protein
MSSPNRQNPSLDQSGLFQIFPCVPLESGQLPREAGVSDTVSRLLPMVTMCARSRSHTGHVLPVAAVTDEHERSSLPTHRLQFCSTGNKQIAPADLLAVEGSGSHGVSLLEGVSQGQGLSIFALHQIPKICPEANAH